MRIYLSYGCKQDQVIALRTSTLCAAHGIATVVPSAETREKEGVRLNKHQVYGLKHSDVLFVIRNFGNCPMVKAEIAAFRRLHGSLANLLGLWVVKVPQKERPFADKLRKLDGPWTIKMRVGAGRMASPFEIVSQLRLMGLKTVTKRRQLLAVFFLVKGQIMLSRLNLGWERETWTSFRWE